MLPPKRRHRVSTNPLYLLSALSMLIGCYTLAQALDLGPGQAGRLSLLLAALNVYELLLVALGLVLLQRGRLREGSLLLCLELLFLGDATLLNAEFFAISVAAGVVAWAAVSALALVKLRLVVRGLGGGRSAIARLWVPLAAGFAIPGGFAALVAEAWLTPGLVYAFWWLAALIALLHVIWSRAWPLPDAAGTESARRALEWLPPVSVVGHLVAASWIHDAGFVPADLSPLLLAAAAAGIFVDHERVSERARLLLPAWAVALSLLQRDAVGVTLFEVKLSALRLTLLAAGLVYFAGWRLQRDRRFGWGAGLCLGAATAGYSPGAIAAAVGELARTLWVGVRILLPRTALQWGVSAIVTAFVLLGAGAVVSLRSAGDGSPGAH